MLLVEQSKVIPEEIFYARSYFWLKRMGIYYFSIFYLSDPLTFMIKCFNFDVHMSYALGSYYYII